MSAGFAPFVIPVAALAWSVVLLAGATERTPAGPALPVGALLLAALGYKLLLLYTLLLAFGLFGGLHGPGAAVLVLGAGPALTVQAVRLRRLRTPSAAYRGAFWLCALYVPALAVTALGFVAVMALGR